MWKDRWALECGHAGEWPIVDPEPDTIRMPEAPPIDAASRERTRATEAWMNEPTLVSFPIYVTPAASACLPPVEAPHDQTSTCAARSSPMCVTRASSAPLEMTSVDSRAPRTAPVQYALAAFVLGIAVTCGAPFLAKACSKYSGAVLAPLRDASSAVVIPRPVAPGIVANRAGRSPELEGARPDPAVRGVAAPPPKAVVRPKGTPPPSIASPDMLERGIGG